MKKRLQTPLIAIIATFFSTPCFAESSDDFLSDIPVVISASRLNQSVLKSPSAVTVIDRAMIEATGFIEIADILRLVPGFHVAHAGGNNFTVVSHGNGWEYSNRMQVLINGRSTYTSAVSVVNWETLGIHIEDIEKIEVVRGPAPSAFSSNSFSGVINIITRDIALDDKFYVHARSGNKGEQELLLRHSNSIDNIDYRFTASTRQNDGFDDAFDDLGFNNVIDERDLSDLSFSAKAFINDANTLSARLSYTNGFSGEKPIDEIIEDRDTKVKAVSGQFQWNHILSESQELQLNFYHNYRNENDLTPTRLPLSQLNPGLFLLSGAPDQHIIAGARTYRSNRSDIELQYSEVLDNNIQYVVGAGARYDTMNSRLFFSDNDTVSDTQLRLFGNVEMPIVPRLTANFGALIEKSRLDETKLSPRLSFNWQINRLQSFRASIARAYRLPSLLEKNIALDIALSNGFIVNREVLTDKDLESEKVTSYDIGYLGQAANLPLSWEFKLYKEQYDDTVEYVIDRDVSVTNGVDIDGRMVRLMNAGWFDTYGFEGVMTYRPEKHSFLRFHFNLGHGDGEFLHNINDMGAPPEYRETDTGIPRNSYGILAAKQFNSWQFNLGVYHTGNMQWFEEGDFVPHYTRIDTSIIKHIKLSNKTRMTIKLAAQNVGNTRYIEFKNDFEFEPRYYATLAFTQF